jgi:SPP1 family predicted phage head-tail adaptor
LRDSWKHWNGVASKKARKKMQAGRLRHRVTLQSRDDIRGSTGEMTFSWSDLAEVWASVEPVAGREFFAAAQVQSNVDTRIRIRYRPGLTEKIRVKFASDPASLYPEYFDVVAVLNQNERDREIHLMCKRVVAEGWTNET